MSLAQVALGLLTLASLIGVAAADGADSSPSAPKALSAREEAGKRLYDHTCIHCHGPGYWGTNRLSKRMDEQHALLENRTDLAAQAIRAIVRNGIGSMPPLRKTELSDADVASIAAYLTRNNR